MSTEGTLQVADLHVQVIRKDIKNLHLGVYPPAGRVRVAAPLAVDDEAVRLAVINKLPWIRRQQASFQAQRRLSSSEAVPGESWYVFGERRRLKVSIDTEHRPAVEMPGKSWLVLRVPPEAGTEQRLAVLDRWYRRQLRDCAGPLISEWQSAIGVSPTFWGIKRMKTKWGSCNRRNGRVWLNAELAKKPPSCLEYIVVHELVHLLEPTHGERFVELMDVHLPSWRARRDELNSSPLAHEDWAY